MKTTFYTFIILFFSGLSYGQDADCPCPKFSKWQRLMDKGKYEEAYELAEEITTYITNGTVYENEDYVSFDNKYGKTICYLWYKAEAAYKSGKINMISNNYNYVYHRKNNPKALYKYRFYCIENGKHLLATNNIENSLQELELAWKLSSEEDLEKCDEKDLDNNLVMYQLAELLGDAYTANKDYENALKYYKFYDSNKYSNEINNKIAFAKQNLENKK